MTNLTTFRPMIVGFLCNWCSYRAADLAGTSRMHYAPTMLPIRVMCTARVEPQFVLKALREGADGVLIAGCHPGECHYVAGNLRALRRYMLLKQMLRQFGIEDERVQIVWAAASESNILAQAVDRMTEQLQALGPLRWKQTVLLEARGTDGRSENGQGGETVPAGVIGASLPQISVPTPVLTTIPTEADA